MPPRLGCKKSRNGCVRCKLRKVKCDEQQPTCGACQQHALPCEFPRRRLVTHKTVPARRLDSSSPATIGPEDSPSTQTSHTSDEDPNRHRLLELGLLHYYVTTVAPTFLYVDRAFGLELTSVQIPQVALRNPNLLNTIFAYALLHLHVEAIQGKFPDNVEFFEELGLRMPRGRGSDTTANDDQSLQTELLILHSDYLDKALSAQRNTVSSISDKNADAACVTTILIMMTALVYATQRVHAGESAAYTFPLQWFHLARSFTTVLRASRSVLSSKSVMIRMIDAYPGALNDLMIPTRFSHFKYLLDWQPRGTVEVLDEAATAAYERAVLCIQSIYQYIVDDRPLECLGRLILSFPNHVSDSFVAFVEQGRPRALVLLAHLLAMSKLLDQKWWVFREVADFHVKGIAELVPDEWQWTLAWPLQVISTGVVR